MVTITISGTPGSGKTTVAKLLEKKLGLKHIYLGKVFRELANEHKMTLEEFGKYCEEHCEIDKELDDIQLNILKKKKDVILEGRLAGWLAYRNKIPAFKILIDADLETRVKRIVNREEGLLEKRKKEIKEREKCEAKRYKDYYGINVKDKSIYDFVIDSANKTPKEIVGLIIKKLNG